ncbi:MAG TPA: MFS transporter [Synergistaceae bacterium]|nr:MFS transporter [Synergistaceae bacterium]HPJ25243.1 MFS transporter [Synergistaceae bacterium]HPQ36114.1 MFS transporter [Synergistaceae bacterium]
MSGHSRLPRDFILCFASSFFGYTCITIFFLHPLILELQHVPPLAIGTVWFLFEAGISGFRPWANILIQKHGSRWGIRCGLWLLLGGTAILCFASSLGTILLGRGLQGMGWGIFTVAAFLHQAAVLPPDIRGFGFGLSGLSQLLPQIALVPLAEYLILQGFLRAPLFLALGATALGLGAGFALRFRGGQPGETDPPVLLRHAARTAWKTPPLRGIILSYAIYALMTAPVMPFIANAAKEWNTAGSFFLFPCALAAVLSRAILTRLVDRLGEKMLLPAFFTLFGGALCALWGKTTLFFILGGSCSGIGMGLVQPLLQSLLTHHTPEHLRPSQFALFGAAMDLIWLGTPFIISGGAALLGYGGILRITSTLAFATLPLLYFVLWPPLRQEEPPSSAL